MITAPRTEVLQGTPDLLVLKTPDTLGSFDGFGIARRIQQVSGDALLLNQGTPYPAPVRLRATQMDTFETKRFRVSDNSATARGHRRGTQKKPHLDLQVGLGLTTHTILWERPSRLAADLPLRPQLHALRAGDLQVVGDREDPGHRVGANIGRPQIAFIAHVADERHVAHIDDDVNRRIRTHRVAVESGVAEDGTVFGATDLEVHRRRRQHLDVVNDAGDAFDVLDVTDGVALRAWIDDSTRERHLRAIHGVGEVIENAVPRNQRQLMPYLRREICMLRPVANDRFRSGIGARDSDSQHSEGQQSDADLHFPTIFESHDFPLHLPQVPDCDS